MSAYAVLLNANSNRVKRGFALRQNGVPSILRLGYGQSREALACIRS